MVGTFGEFENPFERVDFYLADDASTVDTRVLHLVASVAADYADVTDAADESDRTWTYTVEVSADDLWDTGGGDDDNITRPLYAFGVGSKGTVALVSEAVEVLFEDR